MTYILIKYIELNKIYYENKLYRSKKKILIIVLVQFIELQQYFTFQKMLRHIFVYLIIGNLKIMLRLE